jgi:hypothetical protein
MIPSGSSGDQFVFMPTGKGKTDIKISLDTSVYKLVKALAGVKGISMNKFVNQAVERYLEDEENRQAIEYHRLDEEEA